MQNFFRFPYQEVTNCFWNRVFDVSEDKIKVVINPFSHLLNENISALLRWWLSLLLLWRLIWITLIVWTIAWWLSGYDISSICFVPDVVCEKVILLRIDQRLNNLSRFVSFLGQYLYDDIHDFWNHCREPLENFINNLLSDLLELLITILNELKGWISKFFKLWRNQINENINRWETWQSITFMHLDGLLNVHIVIFTASFIAFEFLI